MRRSYFPNKLIPQLAVEAVFLVIAVFFALAVDEAWEDHENTESAKLTLSRIHQELEGNRELIEEESALHRSELEKIQLVLGQLDSDDSILQDSDFNLNLTVSILRDTAWRAAQFTDVLKYFPYEEIENLTSVYLLQELYQSQVSQAFSYQGGVNFLAAEPTIQLRSAFQMLLKVHTIEQALLKAYGKVDN